MNQWTPGLVTFIVCLTLVFRLSAQESGYEIYTALDKDNPIQFNGSKIVYKQDTITLGPKAFFIDGQLPKREAEKFEYVYNSVNEAIVDLMNGTEEEPMKLYIAPYVYWIDDPDNPEVRFEEDGSIPYGLEVSCEWLSFIGLTPDPRNVVLAGNRGQTIGARGNFTMFKFIGDGTHSESLTFGNYCNVDLEFPLKPELNRERRADAIVQAQLIHCNGDKILARNTRFISRLNLCNFVGSKRALFDRCHFECTDDALNGVGVYLNCTFDFYSSKPFYHTRGTGAVFLNCDIRSMTGGTQYFTKANGQLALVDTRIHSGTMTGIAWRDFPPIETRNYQYNVTWNDDQVLIGADNKNSTVPMNDLEILNAYRFKFNDRIIYNTYNLLSGLDDWDPMGIMSIVDLSEKEQDIELSNLPVQLILTPSRRRLETGRDSVIISAHLFRFGNYKLPVTDLDWKVAPDQQDLVVLKIDEDEGQCILFPNNDGELVQEVVITAVTPLGLEAAAVFEVAPKLLPPPRFKDTPRLIETNGDRFQLIYKLDTEYEDRSTVRYYRCSDEDCSNAIEVATSRFGIPLMEYVPGAGDVGYYIRADVFPQHVKSEEGEPYSVVCEMPVNRESFSFSDRVMETDFKHVSVCNQTKNIPGFWSFNHMTDRVSKVSRCGDQEGDAWYYGSNSGVLTNDTGLVQTGRCASMRYTPTGQSYDDMSLNLKIKPFKTAGQGFSIAGLYMDILIKLETETMTGYGLRLERTTKYGNAVDAYFVKYDNGEATQISDSVSISCYRPTVNLGIDLKGEILSAKIENEQDYSIATYGKEVKHELDMEMIIEPNSFGGFGVEYKGGAPAMINYLQVKWE